MAHFAELDINNKVLRVVVACNQDIANNGGEQSEQAAEHFKTVCPFSSNGVKWVQTSYNNNFRKKYAGIGDTFDIVKNKFISPQPFSSWSLDSNDDWQPPVAYHFAELDINNKVLRVVVASDQDIANNGGEQSEQAAEHFKTVCPFSSNGVKWVQTSYNNNFRKKYARIGDTFDIVKNKFIMSQPFASWSLDANDDWQGPVAYPTIIKYENNVDYHIFWDEVNLRWLAKDREKNIFVWSPETLSWISTGN